MPVQVNSRFTALHEATAADGERDDWDAAGTEPAGAGAPKWSGNADAYYHETVTRRPGAGGAIDVLVIRQLWIDTEVARASGLDTNDIITFIDPAGVETKASAALVARSDLDTVPTEIATTRIDLASGRTE